MSASTLSRKPRLLLRSSRVLICWAVAFVWTTRASVPITAVAAVALADVVAAVADVVAAEAVAASVTVVAVEVAAAAVEVVLVTAAVAEVAVEAAASRARRSHSRRTAVLLRLRAQTPKLRR